MAYYTKKEIDAHIESKKIKPLHQQREEFQAAFNEAKRTTFADDLIRFVVSVPLGLGLIYCVIKAIKWLFSVAAAI